MYTGDYNGIFFPRKQTIRGRLSGEVLNCIFPPNKTPRGENHAEPYALWTYTHQATHFMVPAEIQPVFMYLTYLSRTKAESLPVTDSWVFDPFHVPY